MDCRQACALLDQMMDQILAPALTDQVERHVADCPNCAQALSDRRLARQLVRDQATRHVLPPSLSARLVSSLPPEKASSGSLVSLPRPAGRLRWLLAGAGGGAGLALAAGLAMLMLVNPLTDELQREVLDAHLRSLMANHLTDVESSDKHAVKPWFAGRAPLSPSVPDLSAQGYPLVGGRLDRVHDRTAAALVYRSGQHVINLFIWAEEGPAQSGPERSSHNGYHLLRWRSGGLSHTAVSDLNSVDLGRFQQLWTLSAQAGG